MAALFTYLQRARLLLQDQEFAVFNEADLTDFVNMARGQIAAATGCVRVVGTLAITSAAQLYNFSSINLGGASGVRQVVSVSQASYAVASGQKSLHSRTYAWFNTFILSQPNPTAGPPTTWCQYGPGTNSSLYVNLPDGPYTLSLDCECQPTDLTTDSSAEAVSYPYTDAVPFYVAYYAAMTIGDMDKSKLMYENYQRFVQAANIGDTPEVLPLNFGRDGDPFLNNRLGLQAQSQRGQQ